MAMLPAAVISTVLEATFAAIVREPTVTAAPAVNWKLPFWIVVSVSCIARFPWAITTLPRVSFWTAIDSWFTKVFKVIGASDSIFRWSAVNNESKALDLVTTPCAWMVTSPRPDVVTRPTVTSESSLDDFNLYVVNEMSLRSDNPSATTLVAVSWPMFETVMAPS